MGRNCFVFFAISSFDLVVPRDSMFAAKDNDTVDQPLAAMRLPFDFRKLFDQRFTDPPPVPACHPGLVLAHHHVSQFQITWLQELGVGDLR